MELYLVRVLISAALDLPALDLLGELEDAVHQPLRRRRAARHPDIDGDDLVDALDDVIRAVEAAGAGAGAHADDVLRLGPLVVDFLEDGGDLVDDGPGHDQQIRLPRRKAHDLGTEAGDVVVRGDHRHELDGAAGGAEGQRPQRVAARPVDHGVDFGGEVAGAGEVFPPALGFAGEGEETFFGDLAGRDACLAGDDRLGMLNSFDWHKLALNATSASPEAGRDSTAH